MRTAIFLSAFLCVLAQSLSAQSQYSFIKLVQSKIERTQNPAAVAPKMSGDTTYTIFKNCSVEMRLYFVDGEGFNNLFNPNPTGVYLNGQHFNFFCDPDRSFKQYVSNFLDMYEFKFLDRTYLCFLNYREDCIGEGCRYRCYNVFDITNPDQIVQTSFSSIFEGDATFGDFNSDGILDFIRAAPKVPDDLKDKGDLERYYMITAYSFSRGKTVQLRNDKGEASYIWAEGDNEAQTFVVMQHDWVINLNDPEGNPMLSVPYFDTYISFDPLESNLYKPDGARVIKNKWSLFVKEFSDIDGAIKFCDELESRKFNDVLVMTDQYGNRILFKVMVGNFMTKEQAHKTWLVLKQVFDIESKLKDLKARY